MELGTRTAQILGAAIQEFIETGVPVSSHELYQKYGFNVKPATIRNELAWLTDEGFLTQTHTSSGRIPTNKGYQFLVAQLLRERKGKTPSRRMGVQVSALHDEFSRGAMDDFVSDMAGLLKVLGVGYEVSGGSLVKSGLKELMHDVLSNGELSDFQDVNQIIEDFELIDDRIQDLLNFIPERGAPKVFIGKSPITRSPHLSVIAERLRSGGEEFVLAVVGPRRMDYGENIEFFINFKRELPHYE